MKIRFALLLMSMLAVLGFTGCQPAKEGVLAEVNGIEITQDEFDRDFEVNKTRVEKQYGDDALSQVGIDGRTIGESLRDSILESLIIQKLILWDSNEKEITVSQDEVDASIDLWKDELGGDQAFNEFLDSNGFDLKYYSEYEKNRLLVEKHREIVLSGVEISDQKAQDYYGQNSDSLVEVKASHILLGTEEDAARVLQRLQNGEDFPTVAMLESLDSESAVRGGDLGYFSRGYYSIAEFEDEAFSLEVGEVSGIVKTEVGYHIIWIQDKLDTYEELSDKVIDTMKEESYYDYIEQLRENAKVSKYLK
jgi:parvulin-like peptidyl-prolyl isomerase